MALVIYNPEDDVELSLSSAHSQEFDESQFVSDMFSNRYILVIGNEGVLNMEAYSKFDGDMSRYILDIINTRVFKQKNLYKSFSAMEKEHRPWPLVRANYLQNERAHPTLDHLSPQLHELLATNMFRIVFTTTYDDLIEQAMSNYWGDPLRVVDINNAEDMREFQEAIISSIDEKGTYTYDQPTLFYIFGKAVDRDDCQVVLTDNDAIKFIHRWMNDQTFGSQFIDFITSKKMMALGCNFDDWHLRFFWYILRRDINRMNQGQVVSNALSGQQSEKLVCYLEQNNIYHESDTSGFISRITHLLTTSRDNSPMQEQITRYRRRGSIFLSYNSKNFEMATKLFFRLYKAGYGVWFDNEELFGSHNYDERIYKAISQCKIFMPLMTFETTQLLEQCRDKLVSTGDDNKDSDQQDVDLNTLPYVLREWVFAARSSEAAIIPVDYTGSVLRKPIYQEVFETAIVGHACTGINYMAADGFDRLKHSINLVLKSQQQFHVR